MLLLVCSITAAPLRALTVPFAYVSNKHSADVSVINTVTRKVVTSIGVGESPSEVATSPDNHFVYVANSSDHSDSVSVIDTNTNQVVATVPVGDNPTGVAIASISAPGCAGDCDDDGTVTVDEILTMVDIALGNADATACPNGIPSGAQVDVALILTAVNNALNGCQ